MSSTEQAPPAWVTPPSKLPNCSDCEQEPPYEGKHVVDIGFYRVGELNICERHKWLRTHQPEVDIPVQSFRGISMDPIRETFFTRHTPQGQRKASADAAKKQRIQEYHDNVGKLLQLIVKSEVMSLDEIERYTLLLKNTKAPLRDNVKASFFNEINDRLDTRRTNREIVKIRSRDELVKSLRKSLLDAEVDRLVSSDPLRKEQSRIHNEDMLLAAGVGKYLDYLQDQRYNAIPGMKAIAEPPKSRGCNLCRDNAATLLSRVEARSRKPSVEVTYSPPPMDDSEERRRQFMFMVASGVEKELEE